MAEERFADHAHREQIGEFVVGYEPAIAHVRVAGGNHRFAVGLDRKAERRHVRAGDVIERFRDVGEPADLHRESRLFAQFAGDRHRGRFVPFLTPAGKIPQQAGAIGILVRDQQHAAVALEQSGAEMDPNHHAEFDVRARIAGRRMEVEVFSASDRDRMADALALRFAVFVDEQHVPAEEEIDEHDRSDSEARHALVRERGAVVAAGRYYRKDARTVQIGRMAVAASQRGRGIGRVLLDALLDDARAGGYARASLNAQVHAAGFYARAGFVPYGATFHECEILHQAMERDLERS